MALTFTPALLSETFQSLPEAGRYLIAYSGGLDSHVLLDAMAQLQPGPELIAIHVNHSISPCANSWQEHAQFVCEALQIQLYQIQVDASSPEGKSPEDWARQLRYDSIREFMQPGDILFTAHHKDDQAETLLLQLLRGAGVKGLAAMPILTEFGVGQHARPLLAYSRKQLQDYALQTGLSWVDDESNESRRYDRNYLRKEILPGLRQRWPALTDTLSRVSVNQAESSQLLDELAQIDLQACYREESGSLSLEMLKTLSRLRQANLIRYYIRLLSLPVPNRVKTQQILTDIIASSYDSAPCLTWPGAEIRRYRNDIVAALPLCEHDPDTSIEWKLADTCPLLEGELSAELVSGNGINADCISAALTVRFRRGGERIRPAGKQHHQDVKKLFQEAGVPPWQRDRIPFLFKDDKLIAVVGFWIDESVYAAGDEKAWHIEWSASNTIMCFQEK